MDYQTCKKLDREKGDFYVEEEDGVHCVFGTESGLCYGTFMESASAEEYARRLRTEA